MSKTNNEEWFHDDQARWWDDQKRDEEELQQMREEQVRDAIATEAVKAFAEEFTPIYEDRLKRIAAAVYKQGFMHGFAAALLGAGAFIFIR
jgi:hypothetical protein